MYKNPEDHKKFMREWYLRNKERVKVMNQNYDKNNREKVNKRKRAYKNRPEVKAKKTELKFYHANPEYRRRMLLRAAERRVEWRKKIFALLGGERCKKCGFDDYRALQIDHVKGGGRKQIKENPKVTKPNVFYRVIVADVASYQVLCSNCNWIKRYEEKFDKKKKD